MSKEIPGADFFIGTIILWPGRKIPTGWLLCDGSKHPISNYQALYSILGTIYGGDGIKDFAVPNLKGRFPIGADPNADAKDGNNAQNAQNAKFKLGQCRDSNGSIKLTEEHLPPHKHETTLGTPPTVQGQLTIPANNSSTKLTDKPGTNTVLATSTASFSDPSAEPPSTRIYTTDAPNVEMPGGTVTIPMQNLTVSTDVTGKGNALDVMPSYTALNFLICCDGLYPVSN